MMENQKIIYDNLDMLFITLINANYIYNIWTRLIFFGGG